MGALVPVQVDPPVGLVFVIHQDAAIDGVDDNALTTISDSDDPFTRDRLATLGTSMGLIHLKSDDGAAGFDFMAD
jgi:hypothetical protein